MFVGFEGEGLYGNVSGKLSVSVVRPRGMHVSVACGRALENNGLDVIGNDRTK